MHNMYILYRHAMIFFRRLRIVLQFYKKFSVMKIAAQIALFALYWIKL